MENLLFLGVPILKHIRVSSTKYLFLLHFYIKLVRFLWYASQQMHLLQIYFHADQLTRAFDALLEIKCSYLKSMLYFHF